MMNLCLMGQLRADVRGYAADSGLEQHGMPASFRGPGRFDCVTAVTYIQLALWKMGLTLHVAFIRFYDKLVHLDNIPELILVLVLNNREFVSNISCTKKSSYGPLLISSATTFVISACVLKNNARLWRSSLRD